MTLKLILFCATNQGALLCSIEYDIAVPDRALHSAHNNINNKRSHAQNQYEGISGEDIGLLPLPPLGSEQTALGDLRKGLPSLQYFS